MNAVWGSDQLRRTDGVAAERWRVPPGTLVDLATYSPDDISGFKDKE
jgi:hypothetical protein